MNGITVNKDSFKVFFVSLSTLVLNSRDRPENIWLPKRMCLDKQPYKNLNMKNLPQHYIFIQTSQMLQYLSTTEF